MIISGATGTGKTCLSCAFGNGACRQGYKTHYNQVPELLEEIRLSRADGTYIRLLTKFGRARLLILDDFGLGSHGNRGQRTFGVIEECQSKCSVVIASQLPLDSGRQAISNLTVANAILDRLVHSAY